MDLEHGLLLLFIGIPVSIGALYLILNNLDSNYNERMDDTDSDNSFWR